MTSFQKRLHSNNGKHMISREYVSRGVYNFIQFPQRTILDGNSKCPGKEAIVGLPSDEGLIGKLVDSRLWDIGHMSSTHWLHESHMSQRAILDGSSKCPGKQANQIWPTFTWRIDRQISWRQTVRHRPYGQHSLIAWVIHESGRGFIARLIERWNSAELTETRRRFAIRCFDTKHSSSYFHYVFSFFLAVTRSGGVGYVALIGWGPLSSVGIRQMRELSLSADSYYWLYSQNLSVYVKGRILYRASCPLPTRIGYQSDRDLDFLVLF